VRIRHVGSVHIPLYRRRSKRINKTKLPDSETCHSRRCTQPCLWIGLRFKTYKFQLLQRNIPGKIQEVHCTFCYFSRPKSCLVTNPPTNCPGMFTGVTLESGGATTSVQWLKGQSNVQCPVALYPNKKMFGHFHLLSAHWCSVPRHV